MQSVLFDTLDGIIRLDDSIQLNHTYYQLAIPVWDKKSKYLRWSLRLDTDTSHWRLMVNESQLFIIPIDKNTAAQIKSRHVHRLIQEANDHRS